MMTRLRVSLLLCCGLILATGMAQEVVPPAKDIPAIRSVVAADSVDVSAPDTVQTRKQPLPKIDLPEYVITGNDALDLPSAVRLEIPNAVSPISPLLHPSADQTYDHRSAMPARELPRVVRNPFAGWSGRARASIATFFTPRLDVQAGLDGPQYRIGMEGMYGRTKGWQQGTDASEGKFGIRGAVGLDAESEFLDDAELSGDLNISTRSYKFYGSPDPNLQRKVNQTDVQLSARSLGNAAIPYEVGLNVGSGSVSDSNRSVSIGVTRFGIRTRFEAIDLPWSLGFHVQNSTVGLSGLGSASSFGIHGGTEFAIGSVGLQVEFSILSAAGGKAERLTRLYPRLEVLVPVAAQHQASFAYTPDLVDRSFQSELRNNQYLATDASIRPTDINQDVQAALRSRWTSRWETKVHVSFKKFLDYAVFTDTTSGHGWRLEYLRHVTTISGGVEAVAKFTAFDYFSATFGMQTVTDAGTISRVPYLPQWEGGVSYERRMGERISITPRLHLTSPRYSDVLGLTKVPAIIRLDVRAAYEIYEKIRIELQVENILDRKNEWWYRYRERPFSIRSGIEIRW